MWTKAMHSPIDCRKLDDQAKLLILRCIRLRDLKLKDGDYSTSVQTEVEALCKATPDYMDMMITQALTPTPLDNQ